MSTTLPAGLGERLLALAAARQLLVCTDYDGTLAPLAPRPELARLLPGASDLLYRLARLAHTRVAIISGRARDNLRTHSGFADPVLLVGSHGAELPGQALRSESATQLDAVEALLVPICAASPGAWLERKPLGLTVHVRQASVADAARVLDDVRSALLGHPALNVTSGKAVLELSLSRVNKADAVQWLREEQGDGTPVIYMGDDVTDETVFAALRDGDLGIKVGAGPTCAAYRVASEQDVLEVLQLLWQQRSGGGP